MHQKSPIYCSDDLLKNQILASVPFLKALTDASYTVLKRIWNDYFKQPLPESTSDVTSKLIDDNVVQFDIIFKIIMAISNTFLN